LLRETLLAESRKQWQSQAARAHDRDGANEPEGRCREKADAAPILPARRTRVTSSQNHSASWIAAVLTRGNAKKFGLVARFLQRSVFEARFELAREGMPVFWGDF
jgi:hypothetical protein